jgi:hypothetical protein
VVEIPIVEDMTSFQLNNFYGFDDDEIAEAVKERCGQLIL